MKDKSKHDAQPWEGGTQVPDYFLPGVSLNTVLFRYHHEKLHVLLLKFATTDWYMLPGGFIKKEEDLVDAVQRSLKERIGLHNIYLEQFYIAGKAFRSTDAIVRQALKKIGYPNIDEWLTQRRISACYYGLLDESELEPTIQQRFISEIRWCDVHTLPRLLFDHNEIMEKAVERLQIDMEHKLISNNLLKEPFTMSELRKLYEAVYHKTFTRSNFQRKMLNKGILDRVGKKHEGQANKAPYLYRFKKKN